jgi:DnaK suppressor protein
MRKPFLTKVKKILEDQRNSIVEKVKLNSNIDIDIDGDETDEIQGKIIALANAQLIARDKDKMAKIELALKKISDGSFGYCEECGEEIAEKRLLVNPGFITCIGCAERLEIINKRNGR